MDACEEVYPVPTDKKLMRATIVTIVCKAQSSSFAILSVLMIIVVLYFLACVPMQSFK